MPLATAVGQTGALNWVHGHHLGTPILTTNAAGQAITPTGTAILGFPGQFANALLLSGAQHYYNRYRDYNFATGRYIQADPIGLAGDDNPYAYAAGNPLRYTDPSGLIIDTIADVGFIGYDVYRLLKDNVFGSNCPDTLGTNLTALGADLASALIPGLTGGGLGVRAIVKGRRSYIDGFRAVSKAEADDIAKYGFRPNPSGHSMNDKWFSETQEGAEKFRERFSDLDEIVKTRVPQEVYDRSFKSPNIDNTGPGFCVICSDLGQLPKP